MIGISICVDIRPLMLRRTFRRGEGSTHQIPWTLYAAVPCMFSDTDRFLPVIVPSLILIHIVGMILMDSRGAMYWLLLSSPLMDLCAAQATYTNAKVTTIGSGTSMRFQAGSKANMSMKLSAFRRSLYITRRTGRRYNLGNPPDL